MFLIIFTQSNFYEKRGLELIKKDDSGKPLPVRECTSLLTFVEIEGEFL
jgi:hypothetical protein